MTRREIVKAAIHHKPTPRIPYCIDLTGEAQKKLCERTGYRTAAEFLDNDIIQVNAPWWNWHELGPEWQAPSPPASRPPVMGCGNYGAFFDMLRQLRGNSDKYILLMVYGSHFEKAYFARGIENFLADMVGEPDFTQRLLRQIIDLNMAMLENILSAPELDGVLLGSDWGTQQDLFMSPAVWEEMIRPGEQREYDLVHEFGKDVWVHSCGNVQKVLPSLVEMGLNVLNPVQPEAMDLATLKQAYGDRLAFWGGISTQNLLPFGTADDVRSESRRIRDLMSDNGGYVFAPSQGIQEDVPVENILALVEVAKEIPQFSDSFRE